jgi:hypothetical protein
VGALDPGSRRIRWRRCDWVSGSNGEEIRDVQEFNMRRFELIDTFLQFKILLRQLGLTLIDVSQNATLSSTLPNRSVKS